VKIKGTCKRDGREFLVEQVVSGGGRCPWDGEPFEADYAVVMVDALRDAEEAGSQLVEALEKVAAVSPEFRLQASSVLGPIQAQLARLEQNLIKQG